jgi:hypothetical protein
MNSFYNHIKNLVDISEYVISNLKDKVRRLGHQWTEVGKHDANQLDGKQRHTGFNYYEYDMSKFGTPGCAQSLLDRNSLNFQEHLEDPEHDQARHQGINGHGQSETC